MSLKIEQKEIPTMTHRPSEEWVEFLEAVKKCEVGDSFYISQCPSNYRRALSIAQIWLGFRFRAIKEKDGFRVGRIQ